MFSYFFKMKFLIFVSGSLFDIRVRKRVPLGFHTTHPRFQAIFYGCLSAKVPFTLSLAYSFNELMQFIIDFS